MKSTGAVWWDRGTEDRGGQALRMESVLPWPGAVLGFVCRARGLLPTRISPGPSTSVAMWQHRSGDLLADNYNWSTARGSEYKQLPNLSSVSPGPAKCMPSMPVKRTIYSHTHCVSSIEPVIVSAGLPDAWHLASSL